MCTGSRLSPVILSESASSVGLTLSPVYIAWANGTCLDLIVLHAAPTAEVHVLVPEPIVDGGHLSVLGCGSGKPAQPGDTVTLTPERAGPCWVMLHQNIDGVRYMSQPVEVDVVIGETYNITVPPPQPLELAPEDPGWRLVDGGDYHQVGAVHPNSPAARAGIRPGDRLVSIEGDLNTLPVMASVEPREGEPFEVALAQTDRPADGEP